MDTMADLNVIKSFMSDITRLGHLANSNVNGETTRSYRRWLLATVGMDIADAWECQ